MTDNFNKLITEIQESNMKYFELKPYTSNTLKKDLENLNIWIDTIDIYHSFNAQIVRQKDYYKAIIDFYDSRLTESEKITKISYIDYMLLNVDTDFKNKYKTEIDTLNCDFIEIIDAYFKHRFLYRNLKAYYMQEIYKEALLKDVACVDSIQSFEIIENQILDAYLGVDLVLKATHVNSATIYTNCHITKKSSYSFESVFRKMSKNYLYAYTKENEKVVFKRNFDSSHLILEYKGFGDIEICKYFRISSDSKEYSNEYLKILAKPSAIFEQDLNYKERESYFENTVLPLLDKFNTVTNISCLN